MSDSMKQAWRDVEDGFSTLGQMMRERYQGATDDHAEEVDTSTDSDEPRLALQAAFDKLIAAGRDFGERAADVVRDDDVKSQARRAASSLNNALSATVDLIGEQVAVLFKRSRSEGGAPPAVSKAEPPSDDPMTSE
jgi:hypothetical protein